MRIPNSALKSTVYLYSSVNDAMTGVKFGGSGFLVGYPFADRQRYHIYAITNSHVARGAPIIRLNTDAGDRDVIPITQSSWLHHPEGDDIAAAALVETGQVFDFSFITFEDFVTAEDLRLWQTGPGDEVHMIGRFINHEGEQRNLPTVRMGTIAMMPFEKIRHETGLFVDAFLVEMHSLAGYSGSPVFLPPNNQGPAYPITDGKLQLRMTVRLLGIDFGHSYLKEPVRDNGTGQPLTGDLAAFVRSNTGMAHVAPAWRIADVLEREEFKNQRVAAEERFLKSQA